MKRKISIFFLIGITLYLIDIGLNSYNDKEIYISDQEIISLVNAWKSQVGRNPNEDEITRIINNLSQNKFVTISKNKIRSQWDTYSYFKNILN